MDTGVISVGKLKGSNAVGAVITALVAVRFVVVAETCDGVKAVRLSAERPFDQAIEIADQQGVLVEDAGFWQKQEPTRWQQIASTWPDIDQ